MIRRGLTRSTKFVWKMAIRCFVLNWMKKEISNRMYMFSRVKGAATAAPFN
jgi:hypothetical protein